jgi:uncharacterized protein with FMN-binding domain
MRAPFVIGATVAGVAGIMAFHPHAGSGAAIFTSPGTRAVGGSSTNGGGATSGAPPASGSTPSAARPSGAPSRPAAPSTTTAPATATSRTASGNVTQYRFGVLQVTAKASGGRITNVSTQVQSSDPRSQQIDDAALPMLRDQALSAQSANIQGVSGATYTSEAFISSLQGALSSMGLNG